MMSSVMTQTILTDGETIVLPKAVAFDNTTELEVSRSGEVVTLRPVKRPADPCYPNAELVARLRALPNPTDGIQKRDPFDDPERPGL